MKYNNICFVAALVCALVADTAVYARLWIIAVIMYVGFAFFAIRMIFENNRHDEKLEAEYKRTRRAVDRLYKYIEDNRLMTAEEIKTVIEQEDKPRGAVRPGSRPSIEYMNMKVEQEAEHDAGREDRETA